MTFRYRIFSILLFTAALIVVGCDQGNQNPDFTTGDTYIINQPNSFVGDAGKTSVIVPDTVDYVVQAFTIEKDYTWTVNGEEPPVMDTTVQTHVWSEALRGDNGEGEFISVVFGPEDPFAPTDAPETTHSITVDAEFNDGSDDGIDPRTIEVTATIPGIAEQINRLSSFTVLAASATSADVDDLLAEGGPFTLLGPRNTAVPEFDPSPTQATDEDEPPTSSVLGDLLKYHAIAGDIASGEISDGQTVETLYGDQTVTFGVENDSVITINGEARVVQPDVPVNDGSLHRIDGFLTPSTASIDFTDRTRDPAPAAGDTVTVQGSFFPEGGGFIALHDSTERANQGAVASVIGSSEFVPSGIQNEVRVVLDEPISDTTAVEAMAHKDTNGNQQFDFVVSGGTEDTPYLLEGEPVIDVGMIRVPSE